MAREDRSSSRAHCRLREGTVSRYIILAHLSFELNDPEDELDEGKAVDHVRRQLKQHYPENEIVLVECYDISS